MDCGANNGNFFHGFSVHRNSVGDGEFLMGFTTLSSESENLGDQTKSAARPHVINSALDVLAVTPH